ncbi:hypothetical protein AYM40_11855 [Paraburkholderia phytofirmans OLGA172]|uniref:Uncharacterized protein n=1 Tax=Paraburkholderia phytofirmans OLGA172 TaxID=1417228 RepID=A0A160FKK7_9BURK|nr:hypothetical protein AYM40_11855 [Paraburkholderia phytofirmans OLGA172]
MAADASSGTMRAMSAPSQLKRVVLGQLAISAAVNTVLDVRVELIDQIAGVRGRIPVDARELVC